MKISLDIIPAAQMVDIKHHVGKFLSDEIKVDGKMTTDQSAGELSTTRTKELVAIIYTIGNFPQTWRERKRDW